MLFNSPIFLLVFLPVVLAGFLVLTGIQRRTWAGMWLTAASLFFYGYWDPRYVPLLLASMVFNYQVGSYLAKNPRRAVLLAAIALNLVLLGYFKYTTFVVGALSDALGTGWVVPQIVLPLAISFFTFQQIAYLSDAYDGEAAEHDFANYCLFITFFPHLVAGPITHHREMLPQFTNAQNFRPRWDVMAVGSTLFLIGLFKKVEVADRFSAIARPAFQAARGTEPIGFLDAWGGALAYSLQIYFDFSGYTDMAIGLGLLFCIRLPQNFNSPYKARNVIDFWSRWHMTLTRFLTAYVYNPITVAITRARAAKGLKPPRRGKMTLGGWLSMVALPTAFTMFVSGVWHGAGWQFIAFGLVHGLYLCVNHGYRELKARRGVPLDSDKPWWIALSVLLTFLCVVVGQVFFRADDLTSALRLLAGMAGLHGVTLPPSLSSLPGLSALAARLPIAVGRLDYVTVPELCWIGVALAAVWSLPNAQQLLRNYETALQAQPRAHKLQTMLSGLTWRPSWGFGLTFGAFAFFVLMRALSAAPTEFLYFQF
jgi:alginate O-acetyltransferase complex protein AlgI